MALLYTFPSYESATRHVQLSLILEFRGKLLWIARDIAREILRIARGIALQLREICAELRGLRGKFRENTPKYCVIREKFWTNFKVLHCQNPKKLPPSSKYYMRNIKFKSLLAKFTCGNISQKKNKKNFVISLQLPKINHTIWQKITGLRGNCARFAECAKNTKLRGLRGFRAIAKFQDEWTI